MRFRTALAWILACFALGTVPVMAQDYRLSPGDAVEFDILDDDEPLRSLTVAQDGQVQLPLIGAITIANLTVSEAIEMIRATYIDADLLRDPKVALSIASFRPVFVLGDVAEPGMIDYLAQMTVEQAVGLAGGPTRINANSDEQLLTEASLRGELRVVNSEIARQSAVMARLYAQRDRSDALDQTNLPEAVQTLIDPTLFDDYGAVEAEILLQEREDLQAERNAMQAQSDALSREIAFLDERMTTQRSQIEIAAQERDRIQGLVQRGTLAGVALTEAERDFNAASEPLLETQRKQAESERQKAQVDQNLLEINSASRRTTLEKLQSARLDLDRLVARHASIEERIYLVSAWQSERSQEAFAIDTGYRIRRDVNGELTLQDAQLTDRMLPGDVLLVTIELPG